MFDNQYFNDNNNNSFSNNINNYNNNFAGQVNQNMVGQGMNNQTTVSSNQPFMQNNGLNSLNNAATNVDVPPELGEIKNLNDAMVTSAPTMDVLGPAYVMPDNLPTNDPLEAYDNGNLNINNPSAIGVQNNPLNTTQSYTTNSFQNNTPVNGFSNQFNANPSMMNQVINNGPIPSQPLGQPSLNQPLDGGITSPNTLNNFQYEIPSNNQFNPFSNVQVNAGSSLNPNDTFNVNNNFTSPLNYETLANKVNFTNQPISSDPVVQNESPDETDKEEILPQEKEDKEKDVTSSQSEETKEEQADDDSSIDEEKGASSLNDLGLDDTYAEPDSLEIMDLDSEKEEQSFEENDESSQTDIPTTDDDVNPVLKSVDKIKTLIEELKGQGQDIELDEFDFEEMFQLIIKLKK